jgi:hypothetical protein
LSKWVRELDLEGGWKMKNIGFFIGRDGGQAEEKEIIDRVF